MDVGVKVFSECAYEDVVMEDVARRANASRALMYHYFPTKSEFFAAIWKRAHDRLLAEVSLGGARSVRDDVAAGLAAFLSFYQGHAPLVAIANRSSIANDPVLRIPISDGMRLLCDRVLDAITSAALAGWVAFVREITVEWLLDQRISRPQVVELCMAVLDVALGNQRANAGLDLPR
jgi:AcrR family transcriptional regulator